MASASEGGAQLPAHTTSATSLDATSIEKEAHDSEKSSFSEKTIEQHLPRPSEDERVEIIQVHDVAKVQMSPRRKAFAFAAMCIAVLICAIETFILTTAMPVITQQLGASDSDFAWIGSAYLLTYAAGIPIWARLSDIFGRRIILGATSGLFLVGTVVGATAQTSAALVSGRAVQGTGVGGLMVVTNICVVDMYLPRERAFYFGIVGAMAAISSTLGPFIGGVLTEKRSWRLCFWIEIPFTTISCLGMLLFFQERPKRKSLMQGLREIDWLGSISVAGGTVMLLLGLQFGVSASSWQLPRVIILLVLGGLAFVLFVLVEWKVSTNPLIPLRFFGRLASVAVLAACFFQSLIMTAATYFIPLYFQVVLGATPLQSGVYFLPTTITLALLWTVMGHLIKKTGQYVPAIRVGAAAMLLGAGLFIDSQAYVSWPRIICSQVVVAIGLGLTYQAPLIALYDAVAKEDASLATSTFQFLKQFGQTISVVFGQLIIQGVIKSNMGLLLDANLPDDVVYRLHRGDTIVAAFAENLTPHQIGVMRGLFTHAMRMMWIFYTCIAAAGLVASFMIPHKKLAQDPKKVAEQESTGEKKV